MAEAPITTQERSPSALVALVVGAALVLLATLPVRGEASELPESFEEEVVFSGLTEPTTVQFAGDGRVFVAEKSGLVKVFDDLDDSTPTVFADLRTQVHNFWDRGLLGLALDPDFPVEPYVYVLYTYDLDLSDPGRLPRWGTPGVTADGCPDPPGATDDGCVVSGRLSRLEALGDVMTGPEQVLIEDAWCQQYPSHTVGSLGVRHRRLALCQRRRRGQLRLRGLRAERLSDRIPPGTHRRLGGAQTPPTAEGGALRSQDLRTGSDPTALNGKHSPCRPRHWRRAAGQSRDRRRQREADRRRRAQEPVQVADPARAPTSSGSATSVGSVGGDQQGGRSPRGPDRELRLAVLPGRCWPGRRRRARPGPGEDLYDEDTVSSPHFAYSHANKVVAGESCPPGTSAISGLAFYEGGVYPAADHGALFFADHARRCIWAMQEGPAGDPDRPTS